MKFEIVLSAIFAASAMAHEGHDHSTENSTSTASSVSSSAAASSVASSAASSTASPAATATGAANSVMVNSGVFGAILVGGMALVL